MGELFTFPTPASPVERILSRFDRDKLSGFIEVAIGLLDFADGDPDFEPNGDELDANAAEDDFMAHKADGPGCPIADPDKAIDDDYCDDPFMDREPEDYA